jgi:hypothetical protein
MVKILLLLLVLSFQALAFCFQNDGNLGFERLVEYKKKRAHGHLFGLKRIIVPGKVEEKWFVDKKAVSFDTYLEMLMQAEKEDVLAEVESGRRRAEKKAQEEALIKRRAACRLLELALKAVSRELERIAEYQVDEYLQWAGSTFQSRGHYDKFIKEVVPRATEQLKELQSDGVEYLLIEQRALEIEGGASRLSELVSTSLAYMVTHCTDTMLLKRIVEVL